MGVHNCAVPNCYDKTLMRHRFPNPSKDRSRFDQWLQLIGNDKLSQIEPMRIFNNYRVCHRHFTSKDFVANRKLYRLALPSMNLPEQIGCHILEAVPSTSAIPLISERSTSSILENLNISDDNLCLEENTTAVEQNLSLNISREILCVTPTTSRCIISSPIPEIPDATNEILTSLDDTDAIDLFRKTHVKDTRTAETLLKSINVSRSSELTSKAKTLYKKARHAMNTMTIYKKRSTGKRGIRFTVEEKLLSLVLYKTSGPGYRFLSNIFNLPSRRTLSRLLQGVSVEEGINDFLMENLKKATANLKHHEKLCMLMFDEITLMPHLTR